MTDSSDNIGMPMMQPVEEPLGEKEVRTGPTVRDLNVIPVPYGRNAQTDCRTIAQVAGGNPPGNIMDDRDHDDGDSWLSDMNVTSLGTEKRRRGWDPLATPYGAEPNPANTSGTRGADDVKPMMPDGSMP